MPQPFRRFTGKTCMNGGVVKLHLIENTNSCEYPRVGNEQTIGRQRVGIPLKPRCKNRQTAQPTSGASGRVPFVPRDYCVGSVASPLSFGDKTGESSLVAAPSLSKQSLEWNIPLRLPTEDWHVEQLPVPVCDEPEIDTPLKLPEGPGREPQQMLVGSQVQEVSHVFFPAHILRDLVIFTSRLRRPFVLQSKCHLAAAEPQRDNGVVFFPVSQVCQCVLRADLCFRDPSCQQPGFCHPQFDVVEFDRVDHAQVFTLVAIRTQREREALLDLFQSYGAMRRKCVDVLRSQRGHRPSADKVMLNEPLGSPVE